MTKHVSVAVVADVYGVDNIRVMYPAQRIERVMGFAFTSSSTPHELVEGRFVLGQYNRDVRDDYKCVIQAIDPAYGNDQPYTSDLVGILNTWRADGAGLFVGDKKIEVGFVDENGPEFAEFAAKLEEVHDLRIADMGVKEMRKKARSRKEKDREWFWANRENIERLDRIRRLLDLEEIRA